MTLLMTLLLSLLSSTPDACHVPVPVKAAFVPFMNQDLPSSGSVGVSIQGSEHRWRRLSYSSHNGIFCGIPYDLQVIFRKYIFKNY